MDLFDKIIIPIHTYNSETWGSVFFTKQSSRHSCLSENKQKNPVEKIQISFLKHLLGVNSCSTIWAVLSETNSKPILCKIIFKILRYWKRINELPIPILKSVLITNKQLQKEGKPSWLTGIVIMTEIFRANDVSPLTNLGNLTSTTLKKLLDEEWHLKHKKFYTIIKERPVFENYLNMENPKFRQAITKFRISAHKNFQQKLVEMKIRTNTIGFAPFAVKELEMKFITFMNVMTWQCNSGDKGDSFKIISNKVERCRSNNLKRTM